jgi:signal transduction histidine kinase
MSLVSAYAVAGVATWPGTLPAPRMAGALAEWIFFPAATGLGFMFLLFPTGTLPSRRWRPVAALGTLAMAVVLAGFAVKPRLVALPAPGGVSVTIPNPFAVTSLGRVLPAALFTLDGLAAVMIPFLAAALVSLAIRYRAGDGTARLQVKWVAFAAVAVVACMVAAVLPLMAGQGDQYPVTVAGYGGVSVLVLFGIPAAITVAILKHGLYQIDVIISRTVAYGLLSAALTVVYAGIVVGIGGLAGRRGGPVFTIVAAVAIALLFQPVRQRALRIANRLVYGERATPYQVLSDLAAGLAGQADLDQALTRVVALLAGATGATRAAAWIRVGVELRPVASWPAGAEPPAAVPAGIDGSGLPPAGEQTRAVPVRHDSELLGALTLTKPPSDPFTAAEDALLQQVASQAGLVLRNVRLTAQLRARLDELQASRRRLVAAQDAERQKIERNLHDGAQQQLVALTIQLGLLEQSADDPGSVRDLTGQLRAGLQAAVSELRDLAHGIYPPLLADQGLAAALRSRAGKVPLPVVVEADQVGRFPRETESAVYFCTLEALQNVSKYAGAAAATVRLAYSDGSLEFTVTDDGAGFDAATVPRGSGLQGMADRLASLGGTLHLGSRPGHGTIVTGRIPVTAV